MLPAELLIVLIVSALSALSLLVFHYVRSCENALRYYTTAGDSLVRDALHAADRWPYLLAGVLPGVCHFLLLRRDRRALRAGWLAGLPLAFGMVVSLSMEHSGLREIFLPGRGGLERLALNTTALLGFDAVLASVIAALYRLLDRKTEQPIDPQMKNEVLIRRFAIAYVLIFSGWIPALVMCFPGSLDMDALNQIKGYLGLIRIDASNPILSTLFYGWMFQAGRLLGKSDALSFFKIVMIQNVFNAGFMALVCVRSYQFTKSKPAYVVSILFYSLMPMWQRAAQHILKDVLHTGWYLAFYMLYLSCLEKERLRALDLVMLGFCGVMISFTRNAAFFLALVGLIVLLLARPRAERKKVAICLAALATLYAAVVLFIYPRHEERIKPRSEKENYSMQLQQVALYYIEYGDELSEDEIRILNGTLDVQTITQGYTPMISDPVKSAWHGTEENHEEFWALYRRFLFRHPLTMIKSVLMSSFEHFNPWYSGNRNGVSMSKDPNVHEVDYANFSRLLKMVNYWNSWLEHPVSRVFYGNGLYAWILIGMLGYAVLHRSGQAFWGLVPHLALMMGLFMSHVNGLLRYGYPLIAATPLICGYTVYAVSHCRTAPIDAARHAQPEAGLLPGGRKAFLTRTTGKAVQALRNKLRDVCYSVLNRLENKK